MSKLNRILERFDSFKPKPLALSAKRFQKASYIQGALTKAANQADTVTDFLITLGAVLGKVDDIAVAYASAIHSAVLASQLIFLGELLLVPPLVGVVYKGVRKATQIRQDSMLVASSDELASEIQNRCPGVDIDSLESQMRKIKDPNRSYGIGFAFRRLGAAIGKELKHAFSALTLGYYEPEEIKIAHKIDEILQDCPEMKAAKAKYNFTEEKPPAGLGLGYVEEIRTDLAENKLNRLCDEMMQQTPPPAPDKNKTIEYRANLGESTFFNTNRNVRRSMFQKLGFSVNKTIGPNGTEQEYMPNNGLLNTVIKTLACEQVDTDLRTMKQKVSNLQRFYVRNNARTVGEEESPPETVISNRLSPKLMEAKIDKVFPKTSTKSSQMAN